LSVRQLAFDFTEVNNAIYGDIGLAVNDSAMKLCFTVRSWHGLICSWLLCWRNVHIYNRNQ